MKTKPLNIGILGAGKLGVVLTQLALKAGHQVRIAGSGDPAKIALSIKVLTPGAIALESKQVIAESDIIILALPLGKYRQLPADLLTDKLVIDAMNYWWEVDGDIPDLKAASSSSQMVQDFLSRARLVKAFSHIGYHNLLDDARPKGAPERKALAIAGDNSSDNQKIAKLTDDLGFDPVIIGKLAAGKPLEPGQPLFGASVSAAELRRIVAG